MCFTDKGTDSRGKRRASGRGAGRMVNPSESYWREPFELLGNFSQASKVDREEGEQKKSSLCAPLARAGEIALRSALKGGNDRK